MSLSGQFPDAHVGKDGGKGVRDRDRGRLSSDLEQDWNRERHVPLGVEREAGQSAKIVERRGRVHENGSPVLGAPEPVENLVWDLVDLREKRLRRSRPSLRRRPWPRAAA